MMTRVVVLALLCGSACSTVQQQPIASAEVERLVRSLDERERVAALRRDLPALEQLWSEHFTVNAPNNRVVIGRQSNLDTFVRSGIIDFATFDRAIELVRVEGDFAVVMGLETVVPRNDAPSAGLVAGQLVRRRFTNIWKREGATWRLYWRHANVLPSALSPAGEADAVRSVERERLRALVDADLDAARRLHSDDFQLINPVGVPLDREAYLNGIAAGRPDYVAWEAGEMAVRMYANAAVVRYRDVRFDVDADGRRVHRGPMYHTNVYERRDGRWQAVWSQASGVVQP